TSRAASIRALRVLRPRLVSGLAVRGRSVIAAVYLSSTVERALRSTQRQEFGDHFVHDLVRATADAEHPCVTVMALHLAVADKARPTVQLHGIVHHEVEDLGRGVLGHRDLGINSSPAWRRSATWRT